MPSVTGISQLIGQKGPKGDPGEPGTGITLLGELANTGLLPPSGVENGDTYYIDPNFWSWDGDEWINTGPMGIQGEPGPQGPPGDTGPMGPPGADGADGVDGSIGVALNQGELIQGGVSGPEAVAVPSYGYELRRRGVQLSWGRAREAYLMDRNDLVGNGIADEGATVQTYLNEYRAAKVQFVYLEPGKWIATSTTITVPTGITIEGPQIGYETSGAHSAQFRALTGCPAILKMSSYSRLSGISVWLNNKNTIGVLLDGATGPEIGHCSFSGGVSGTSLIWGGGNENINIHDSYFSVPTNGFGIDLQNRHHTNPTFTYYGTDNRSVIERNDMYGNGTYIRVSGNVRIRDHDFEGQVPANGKFIILGEDSGPAVPGVIRFEGNYFELYGGGDGSVVPYGIYIAGASNRIWILGNEIYGGNSGGTWFKNIVGSAAIKFSGAVNCYHIIGNEFSRWDIGISGAAAGEGSTSGTSGIIAGNSFGGSEVNTPIKDGQYGTKSIGGSYYTPQLMQNGTVQTHQGAVATAVYRPSDAAATIDLRRANMFDLDYTTPTTVTPTNATAGQTFTLYFKKTNVTLPNASWRLMSGADETPAAGSSKQFLVDYEGNIRETTRRLPRQTALTAADATVIDATYDATEQAVLNNVRTRVNELETKLRALNLLA